jgi:hypothetical protein
VVVPAVCVVLALAAVAGTLFYLLRPTDIERAESDLQKAWPVVNTLEAEATRLFKDSRNHKERAAEHRQYATDSEGSSDVEMPDWHRATARAHARLADAASDRRDHLLRLTAEYRRLLAEAQCEILQAKEARERGMPCEVAPRVRELLKPILTNH